jgi:hypothetical protein
MAGEKSCSPGERSFRLSALEILLLAVIAIGVAFMLKTIFGDTNTGSIMIKDTLDRMETKIEEIVRKNEQETQKNQKENENIQFLLKNIEDRLVDLERRLNDLEKQQFSQINRSEQKALQSFNGNSVGTNEHLLQTDKTSP